MACELQGVAAAVALGNAVASTPGVAFGVVAPPLEPILALKMWLSWAGLLVALPCLQSASTRTVATRTPSQCDARSSASSRRSSD